MKFRSFPIRSPRQGFTLAEVLVAIALIAVLASVLVPTILGQIRKGDPTRMGSDFQAVRGGAEQFVTDVGKLPGTIGQLTTPLNSTGQPLHGTALASYGANDSVRWRGPYLSKDAIGALRTGFGLTMNTAFDTVSLGAVGAFSMPGQRFMVLAIPMVNAGTTVNDSISVLQLDRQFDDGVLLTGNIRYRIMSGGVDTLKFLMMPVP
jgi:prepilin-type N-terminal cleavage/methylation domain-containing protein